MWDSVGGEPSISKPKPQAARGPENRKAPRRRYTLRYELLEDRIVLNAALAAIPNVTVPASLGYQVPLNGSGGGATNQTYTVTSTNPNIKATVAQGEFVSFNVSHTSDGSASDPSFSGTITFELFNDLTPLTAQTIENIVTSGFYNGKQLFRVASGFPGSSDYIIQGGSPNNTSAGGPSGQPGTPFADEYNPQLAFTGNYQLAMANSGPDTNDSQFFITDSLSSPTASPTFLNFNKTVFGQLVSGFSLVDDMTKVALQSASPGTTPVNPITISTATVSTTNPNGVIHIDATNAVPNETSTVTVTATDPSTNTTATQSFTVTTEVDPNAPEQPYVTYPGAPPANNITVGQGQTATLQIPAVSPTANDQLTYTVQGVSDAATNTILDPTTGDFAPLLNATATVNNTTGIATITPTAGFSGTINFLLGVRDQVNRTDSATVDSPANYNYQLYTLTVNSTTTTVPQIPIATQFIQSVVTDTPTTISLQGLNPNTTGTGSSGTLTYTLTSQPGYGTVSNFNASTGTFTYTPNPSFQGVDRFQYTTTLTGGGLTSPLTSLASTVTLNVAPTPPTPPVTGDTGAVRVIGPVLVVTPLPRTDGGTNTIDVTQAASFSDSSTQVLEVTVNGVLDSTMPAVSTIGEVVVYGGKANDDITIDPSVTVPATLNGGHGGKNVLQAGSTETLENGWFGRNTLIGGTGPNQLIGRAGQIKVEPTSTTDEIFAGIPQKSTDKNHPKPPVGTFFNYVNGHLVKNTAISSK